MTRQSGLLASLCACKLASAPTAVPDAYCATPGRPLAIDATHGLLHNDRGLTAVVRAVAPRGALVLHPDGGLVYTPPAGLTSGEDRFTYVATDAIEIFRGEGAWDGAGFDAHAHGSAWTPVPGAPDEFYGLTDRGPNVDAATGDAKVFLAPAFVPSIGRFVLADGVARRILRIPLKDVDGAPRTGLAPPTDPGTTRERSLDPAGLELAADPRGVDPEGLVALADGTFWVAEEYGPTLLHVAADGTTLERLAPSAADRGRRLPLVLARRAPNRGLEGLTITPDGATLIAVMQSALANDIDPGDAKRTAPVRIVSLDLATGATHQHLYLLDDPAELGTMVSEIAAVSSSELLVLERDAAFPGAGSRRKRIYRVSLVGATDVGTIDDPRGLLLAGATIEAATRNLDTQAAAAALARHDVTPVAKTLALDILGLLGTLDPGGRLFAHDKLEGLALVGDRLVLSNDSDFAVDAVDPQTRAIAPKLVPSTGEPDGSEVLVVDLVRLPARTAAADVTVTVSPTCPP